MQIEILHGIHSYGQNMVTLAKERDKAIYSLFMQPCNQYAKYILGEAGWRENEHGCKIGGRNNNLCYADDKTVLTECSDELQALVIKVKNKILKIG